MQSFLITCETEWERWRGPWNALTRCNPMRSFEWLLAWWHHFGSGHELSIVAISDADQLLGFLPCYWHRTRIGSQLRFLGSGSVCSDYLTAVVDEQRAAEVYAALGTQMRALGQDGGWRGCESLQFDGLKSDDAWLAELAKFADDAGYSIRYQPIISSWVMTLPRTWAELHDSQRGRGVHRKAKKCIARIESNELTVRHLTSPQHLDEGLQQLTRLHQARRRSVGDEGCFADPNFERFLHEAIENMLAAGTACFSLCETGGVVIGVQLLLLGTDTVFMYQSGVDPNHLSLEPGHAIVTGSLLYAISRGYQHYDFLRGDEPYKAFWGAQAQPLQRITLVPPTLKAQALEVVHRNFRWLRTCYRELGVAYLGKS